MSSMVLDTKELQQRLLVWGANADGIVDPETGLPSGVINEATIRALAVIGSFFDIPGSDINVAGMLDGIKVDVGPSELVQKLLEAPPVPLPELLQVQFVDDAQVAAVKLYPQKVTGNTFTIAKRVAANIVRAPGYARDIAALAKQGKATAGLKKAYKDWYDSATKLQKLLGDRIKHPAARAAFKKKLEEAGVDSGTVIAALEKGPLAVAAAVNVKSSGLEVLPILALAWMALGSVVIWNGSDILKAWGELQKESTNRTILEWKKDCISSGKCAAEDMNSFLQQRTDAQRFSESSPWLWFFGGIAIAGSGMIYLSRKKAR